MKIGILTFHRALNYGAVLQAYALQKKLKSMGHEVLVIDYRNKKIEEINSVIDFARWTGVVGAIKELLAAPFRLDRRNKFNKFLTKNLDLYSEFAQNRIDELGDDFDLFIVGSDQVWNPILTENDSTYLLNFVNDSEKKSSYAASIGVSNLNEDYIKKLKNSLMSFKNISVREYSAQKLLGKVIEKNIRIVLDPTLLLDENDYGSTKSSSMKKKYILVYSLNAEIHLMESVFRMAEKNNLPIYYVCNELYDLKKHRHKNIRHILNPSPQQFVDLIKNADYVATNSFHGTVFSIIFHKQFMCEVDYGKNSNSRILDLINACGLRNRVIDSQNSFEDLIDWNQVDKNLEILRKESIEYMKEITNS